MDNQKKYYDKFGFFSIEPEKSGNFDKFDREPRDRRQRSPQYDRDSRNRSRNYSPEKRDYRDERREYRSDKNDAWRNREYSPKFNDRNPCRDREIECDNSWEPSFNANQDFINPPPAPSFTNEPPPPHFQPQEPYNPPFANAPSYNFLESLPPPHMGEPMPTPPPAPTMSQSWTQVPPQQQQEDKVKKEAIALEMRNQRATLAKQKEDYLKKVNVLKRELDSLKQQRIELRGDPKRSPSPDSQRFLKENAKLQGEIINKLKSFENIIDMLNGIIGDNPTMGNVGDKSKRSKSSKAKSSSKSVSSRDSSSSENEKKSSKRKKRKSRSRSKVSDKKFNYVFYDPEMHWCRMCNEFPTTAKDYLNHLHSPTHQKNASAQIEAPWHNVVTMNEGMPSFPGAPSKRTPIKGLQFFVPSTAWYCKLCDQWIGDLHCASAHLKSQMHTQNYANFIELNPHWEMDWMSDRQKNYEKAHNNTNESSAKMDYSPNTIISFQADGTHTKKRKDSTPQPMMDHLSKFEKKEKKKKDKKKSRKKRHSSSDSSATSSDSDFDRKKKKSKKEEDYSKYEERSMNSEKKDEKSSAADDSLISQWMSLKQDTLTDQDKKILEKLRNSVKTKVVEKSEQKIDSRVVSREREARDLLSIQGEKARKIVEKMESRSKEDSYSKYHTEPPKGHLSKRERDEQNEDKFDRHSSDKHKRSYKESSDKKMPFIGKMPLYKSLTNKPPSTKSDTETTTPKPTLEECVEAAKKKRDEINAQIQKVEEIKEKLNKSLAEKEAANSSSLPAPGLVLPTALASAPPPPPPVVAAPPPPQIASYPQIIHRIKKSPVRNIPEAKKPSPPAAVTSKDDPLHKDFQDALDIIFPSKDAAANASKEATNNIPEPPPPEPTQPMMDMYSQEPPPAWMQQNYMVPMGHMPPMGMMGHMGHMGPNMGHMGPPMGYPDQCYQTMPPYSNVVPTDDSMVDDEASRKDDIDDLAMLGIDAEDVGAGGF